MEQAVQPAPQVVARMALVLRTIVALALRPVGLRRIGWRAPRRGDLPCATGRMTGADCARGLGCTRRTDDLWTGAPNGTPIGVSAEGQVARTSWLSKSAASGFVARRHSWQRTIGAGARQSPRRCGLFSSIRGRGPATAATRRPLPPSARPRRRRPFQTRTAAADGHAITTVYSIYAFFYRVYLYV